MSRNDERASSEELPALESALDAVRRKEAQLFHARRLEDLPEIRRLGCQRLELERRICGARNQEHAVPVEIGLGFREEPVVLCDHVNAVVVSHTIDHGVVATIGFENFEGLRLERVNDEVFEAHPLRGRGLDIAGAFIVRNSAWVEALRSAHATHPMYDADRWSCMNHYLFRSKVVYLGVAATGLVIERSNESLTSVVERAAQGLKTR